MISGRYVALDLATVCEIREATPEEIAAYEGQEIAAALPQAFPARRSFFQTIRVGNVWVAEDTGPGGYSPEWD